MTGAPKPQMSFDQYFDLPRRDARGAGSFDIDGRLRRSLSEAIRDSGRSRAEIAAVMTDLVYGEAEGEITKAQIDSWCAPSRGDWNFPVKYLPAFVQATGAIWLLDELAALVGCKVLAGEQALLAELGAILLHERRLKARRDEIEQSVPADLMEQLVRRLGGGGE